MEKRKQTVRTVHFDFGIRQKPHRNGDKAVITGFGTAAAAIKAVKGIGGELVVNKFDPATGRRHWITPDSRMAALAKAIEG